MHIRLNGKPLCKIAETRLVDVYQLLGKYSFTFHLDKRQGMLDIMNPLEGCRVVLESKMTEIVDRLWYPIQSTLSQAGLRVTIVDSEDTRKQLLSESNHQRQGIWISAVPDDAMEVSVHYYFHHRKQSKQLAQLLIMNMLKHGELPIRGASLNWKDRSNYQLSLTGQSWTSVALTYGGFLRLSTEQLVQLGNGITRAAASYFSYLPILDVIEKLRAMDNGEGAELDRKKEISPVTTEVRHAEDVASREEEATAPHVQTSFMDASNLHQSVETSRRDELEPHEHSQQRGDKESRLAQEVRSAYEGSGTDTIEHSEERVSVHELEHGDELNEQVYWQKYKDNEEPAGDDWQEEDVEEAVDIVEESLNDTGYDDDMFVNRSVLVAEYEWEDKEKSHDSPTVDEADELHKGEQSDSRSIGGKEQGSGISLGGRWRHNQKAGEMSNPLHEKGANRELQTESEELNVGEQEQVEDRKRQAPAYSMFTWLHANTVKRADGASKQSGSLLSYLNQQSLTSQPRIPKDPAQDLLLMQRERAKREQSSTDKS
ncbi:hypothetical protein RQP50_02855 [Paenibacillus sp. chi10]|uniref:Uncharacterized protein n=1 Tax=Paenibacillus suaedae TaxID=3077233 RepID=A0AAJ2N2Z0_9BACL|nr:hypothetical protein [Paenibacillus sp. chi10]MDT8975181.1 hypothetical protein [Paenibacillus sp. chi10]